MSKADQLGRGAAFGKAAGARSSRREAFDQALKGDNAFVASLTELPVTLISENPDNPRNHLRNLDETMDTVRELGIIMPIVVATADAYLRNRPERADDLDSGAQYVVVDGHRRLECARQTGLATIPVRVDNARVATDEALLEAAFVANYHRDDMTDLEEAHALKQLVDYYGSQTKAAKRLGIPQGTISTKLSLLKLAPDLQKDLMTGDRKVEHVRNLGKLTPEEQRQKADERAREASARTALRTPPASQPTPTRPAAPVRAAEPADYHAVIIPEGRAASPLSPMERSEPSDTEIPEPRPMPVAGVAPVAAAGVQAQAKPPRPFPYDDPVLASQLCWAKMKQEDYLAFARMTLKTLRAQRPEEFNQLASDLGL